MVITSNNTYTGTTRFHDISINSEVQLGNGSTTGTLNPNQPLTLAFTASNTTKANLSFNRSNEVVQGVDFGKGTSKNRLSRRE